MKIIYFLLLLAFACTDLKAYLEPLPISVNSSTIRFTSTIDRLDPDFQNLIFTNNTNQKFVIDKFEFKGRDKDFFKILDFSGIEKGEIDKFSSLTITLKFPVLIPPTPGAKFAALLFHFPANQFNKNLDSLFVIYLIGNILPEPPPTLKEYTLEIPKINAKIGESFKLPVLFKQIPVIPDNQTDNVKFSISFNETMMTPENPNQRGRFLDGNQIVDVNLNTNLQDIKVGDTLYSIDCIAGLGNSIETPIAIIDSTIRFFKGQRPLYNIKTRIIEGSLTISDIYIGDTIPRLITNFVNDLAIKLDNTSIKDNSNLNLYYSGKVKFVVLDLLGNIVKDYSNIMMAHNLLSDEQFVLERNIFITKGIYLLRLTKNETSVTKLILVE
jgi:hypothetical protein